MSQAGYNVVTAGNGKEALELYQRQKADISLVILDLIMPKTGGAECLEKLLQIDPNVKVLVASGFSVNGPIMDALEDGAEGFIGKPYDAKELLRVVRRVLDEIGLPERRADSVKPTSVWHDGDYRAISAPPPPVSESSPWQDSPGIKEFPRQLRILAIDDREPYLKMLAAGLAQFKQIPLTASSGIEGLRVCPGDTG